MTWQKAWKSPNGMYLYLQISSDDCWDFTVYDDEFNEVDGGQLDFDNDEDNFEMGAARVIEWMGLESEFGDDVDVLEEVDPEWLQEEIENNW